MKVAIGNDHRGFAAKQRLVRLIRDLGHDVLDMGCHDNGYADYPDYAFAVAEQVGRGKVDRGVLICGTGIGMSIAANKVPGVRAACSHDLVTAEMSRRHNDANVLCLSADLQSEETLERMVRLWLETEFEGGRHARRVEKIKDYEKNHSC
jgi:ribose 5-phosphate isomerase B